MRTRKDRIRHAISFEILGLALITPLGAAVFDTPVQTMGVLALGCATVATLWNYVFNLGFDHAMQRAVGHTRKTVPLRLVHALLFELGLLAVLMPLIAWWMGITLLQALVMDLGFAGFYIAYALGFNWAYDLIFPVPTAPALRPGPRA